MRRRAVALAALPLLAAVGTAAPAPGAHPRPVSMQGETVAPRPGDDARGPAWIDVARLRREVRPVERDGAAVWEYELVVEEREIPLADGTAYKVWAFGGSVPGPALLAREGDRMRIRLVNETSSPHTLHSHGLWVPHRMDGVPHALGHQAAGGHSGHQDHQEELPPWTHPVAPGEIFDYEFIARPAGTHFYHCHVNTNEHLDRGMSGPLIVLPREEEPPADHDVALVLDEWDSRFAQDGVPGAPAEMGGYDFFTLNGRSFPDIEPLRVGEGEVVRIRLINAGALAHFMHLHGHSFLVTHRDGARLAEPLTLDTVEVGPGQRVDLLIAADNPGLWCFHCHSPSHVTNDGLYPGGMLTRIQVGPEPFPASGDGSDLAGLDRLRERWRSVGSGGR